jgi:hypothetical protein
MMMEVVLSNYRPLVNLLRSITLLGEGQWLLFKVDKRKI